MEDMVKKRQPFPDGSTKNYYFEAGAWEHSGLLYGESWKSVVEAQRRLEEQAVEEQPAAPPLPGLLPGETPETYREKLRYSRDYGKDYAITHGVTAASDECRSLTAAILYETGNEDRAVDFTNACVAGVIEVAESGTTP